HEYAAQGIDAIDRSTQANLNIAQANPALDPVKVAEAGKTFEDQRESYREAFEQIRKQIEEEKRQREAIVSALASIAIEALPAGSSALQVAKAVGFRIDTATDNAIKAANTKTEAVEMTANDNSEKITALTGATDGISRNIGNIEDKLETINAEVGVLKEDKITKDLDMALAKKTLESLDPAIQEKLRNVPENVIVELTKLKADDAAFRERFQRELQLTDQQMKSLKGLTVDKLLAILAAAGIATGTGGLTGKALGRASGREAATHGESRGAAEINALRKEFNDYKKEHP
ncbi:MAG: hypothetical protein ACYS3S_21695, partial [Planctomycetota bacterium]